MIMTDSKPVRVSALLSLFSIFFAPDSLSQEITLDENFESQSLTIPAYWSGDRDDFILNRENGDTRLQLLSEPDPSRSQLRTYSSTAYGTWEFYFRQEFTSSNLNRAFIFLMSDREDLNYLDGSPVNGYAIRTGENGDPKRLRLIRFDNGIQQEILESYSTLQENQGYRVKVTRSLSGEWQLHTASGDQKPPVPDSDIVIDNTHVSSGYFGFLLRYTSANTDRFFFDQIRISKISEPFSVVSAKAEDEYTLIIEFNREPNPGALMNTTFTIDGRINQNATEMIHSTALRIRFPRPIAIGKTSLSITGLIDQSEQPLINEQTEHLLTIPAEPGDLVINEIMYDPLPPTEFHINGQSEYIELINRRPYAISVAGLKISDNAENPLLANTIKPAHRDTVWVRPEGYLLLYPENDGSGFKGSRLGDFFDLADLHEFHTLRFQRSTLGLNLSGRKVVLSDEPDNILDKVYYHPGLHNPNLMDTRGISLERVNPDLPSADPDNWSSSTHPLGGTPGKQNTLFQQPAQLPEQTGITLELNPFSPYSNNQARNLFINYKLDEPDYLLRVRIFDRYGRMIRNLTESYQAGYEGSLTWDGTTDEGAINRIGIYIIFIEAYNSATGSNRVFRKTAVLAREF
jgi:hypothetical protein